MSVTRKIILFVSLVFLLTCNTVTAYVLKVGNDCFPCAIGRNGFSKNKIEGDGKTPVGVFPLRHIYYRADKISKWLLASCLPLTAIQHNDGWCTDPSSSRYNHFMKINVKNCADNHERLWLDSPVYDMVIVLGYNDDPVAKGRGSAIFLHVARKNYQATAGCIAIDRKHLVKTIQMLTPKSLIIINPKVIEIINVKRNTCS